ncbi:C-type mannose receptor 2 [Stigmatopora nigra]
MRECARVCVGITAAESMHPKDERDRGASTSEARRSPGRRWTECQHQNQRQNQRLERRWALLPSSSSSSFSLSVLLLLLIGVDVTWSASESDDFAFFHVGTQGCLGVRSHALVLSASCLEPQQRWKWVSRGRLFNLGSSLCLAVNQGAGAAPLGAYACDRRPPETLWTWSCGNVLEELGRHLPWPSFSNLSAAPPPPPPTAAGGSEWRLHGDGGRHDPCAKTYGEIYTVQGNSKGRPCHLPFLYDGLWFHNCTGTGREDGHLWCATTYDYGRDELWGFCPVDGNGCDTFWDTDPLSGSCYQFNFQASLSWDEARLSCRQQGADLLSVTELHEQTYINGLLSGYSAALWMGLNDLDINGGWQWADASPLKYLNWEQDRPDHQEEENCAVIRTESSGRWQNRQCSQTLPYVCEKRPNATLDPFSTDSWEDDDKYECQAGWRVFQAGCYKLVAEKGDWDAGLRACQKMDANLVSIHTLPEMEFILRHIKKDTEQVWLGLHDTLMQMDFHWSDHTPVIFTHWHPFEPNNFRNTAEDCVSMWGADGRWDDNPCNLTLPAVCKKAAAKSQGEAGHQDCKQGWKWHSPSCYWLSEDPLTFDEAKKSCEEKAASLLTITNRFEQAFANSLLLGRSDDSFWIGLHDRGGAGSFRWQSGDAVSYTNWNRDQPAGVREGCVAMATGSAAGLWEARECAASEAKYICRQKRDGVPGAEATARPPPRPTPGLTGSCPNGWKSNGDLRYCYKVFHSPELDEKLSWLQAHLFCRKHGADLLSLGGPDEEHFVLRVLHEAFGESEEHEQHWFWIGLNRRNPSGDVGWKWSDGVPVTYQNFGRYSYNVRQCAATDLGSMTWLPMHCDSQLDWICKMPRGSVEKEPEAAEGGYSPEWMGFQEAEYKFFDHRTTWEQAQRICSWFHSSLASVHSPQEEKFLAATLNQMVKAEGDKWWLGLHTYDNDGRFRWSDRSVLNYVSWAVGRPRPPARERRCVHLMAGKGEWVEEKCSSDLPYVCKRVNVTGTAPPTPSLPGSPSGCPEGWTSYGRKCFRAFQLPSQRATWSAAKIKCEMQRGDLAVVSNHLEQALVTTLLWNASVDLWLGMFSEQKARFSWPQPGLLAYTNWAPGQPVDNNNGLRVQKTPGNCVAVLHGNPRRNKGMWVSRACETESIGYLCQRYQDPALPAAPTLIPASPSERLELGGVTYQVLQKRLDWNGALHLCNSLNGTLAAPNDPVQQAYLTLLADALRRPAWIALYNYGGRSYSWLGEEELAYSNWVDGQPNTLSGCGHLTPGGLWSMAPCAHKLDVAICQIGDLPASHRWTYPGSCPHSVGDWSWVAFRNHCYAFNLQRLRLQQDARSSCHQVGAELLSILDETENAFVWEHIQSRAEQARGAWLGVTVKGRGLAWSQETEMSYTNWEAGDVASSVLSPNSCFWIQSDSGLWKPGSCRNRTHGVICKRAKTSESPAELLAADHLPTLMVILATGAALVLLAAGAIYLFRRRGGGAAARPSYDGARYSRSGRGEQPEKNILVSDMELNEQAE